MKIKKMLVSILTVLYGSLMVVPFFTACNEDSTIDSSMDNSATESSTGDSIEKTIEGIYYAYGYGVDFSTSELCSVYDTHEYIQLYKDGTLEYWFSYYDGYYSTIGLYGYKGTYDISNKEIKMIFEWISAETGKEAFATGNVSNGVISFYWNGERNETPRYFCKEGSKPQDKSVEVVFETNSETLQINTYSSQEQAISVPNIPSKEGLVGKWELKERAYEEVDTYKITIETIYTSIGTTEEDWIISFVMDPYIEIEGLEYIGKEEIVEIPMVLRNIEITTFPYFWTFTFQEVRGIVIPTSITEIPSSAFDRFQPSAIYYKGTKTEWDLITIGYGNGNLEKATKYYYSETQPQESGNYWHYDENGSVAVW